MEDFAEKVRVSRIEAIEWELTVLKLQLENVFETYTTSYNKYLELHALIERFEKEAAKLRGEEV